MESRERCPTEENHKQSGCEGDCPHCDFSPNPPDAPLRGIRFSAASVVAFLLPPLLAFVGGFLGRNDPTLCALGVLGGLAVGVILAWGVNRYLCRESRQLPTAEKGEASDRP